MPGPPPKPAPLRRRRNQAGASVRLSAPPARRRAPTLPGARELLAETRRWWRTVWASPMASVWLDADVPALERLARLHDLSARELAIVREGPRVSEEILQAAEEVGPEVRISITFDSPLSASVLSEIRQLEDRLGLSPMSRRRLQWEVERAEASAEDTPGANVAQLERWRRATSA